MKAAEEIDRREILGLRKRVEICLDVRQRIARAAARSDDLLVDQPEVDDDSMTTPKFGNDHRTCVVRARTVLQKPSLELLVDSFFKCCVLFGRESSRR